MTIVNIQQKLYATSVSLGLGGGMLFRNLVSEDGYAATRHSSFDAFKQDQTFDPALQEIVDNSDNEGNPILILASFNLNQ